MYQIISDKTILRVNDNVWIPVDSTNVDYQNFLKWIEEGNMPLPSPEPPAASPNYRGFYDDLLISTAYQNIRAQAVTSLPLTLSAIEFIAAMGDAKTGIPNQEALQTCINNIVATATNLTTTDWMQINVLLQKNNLDNIYTLPV